VCTANSNIFVKIVEDAIVVNLQVVEKIVIKKRNIILEKNMKYIKDIVLDATKIINL